MNPASTGGHLRSCRALIFDFDYTLADSTKGVLECIRFAFREMNLPEPGHDVMRATIGHSLGHAFTQLTGKTDPLLQQEYRRLFLQHAGDVIVGLTTLYDVTAPAMHILRTAGLRLAIASTKNRAHIEGILAHNGLRDCFEVIVGGNDVTLQKPEPEALELARTRLGTSVAETIYVGDSIVDAEAAFRAGLGFIAVLTGTTKGEEFAAFPSLLILESVAELPRYW
ncbi:MAG: HAD family hydrolase [Candidatus Acidiferrales bacterium]